MPDPVNLRTSEWDVADEHPSSLTVVSGIKWVIDGTPIEELALQTHSYPGRPGWRGRLDFPMPAMRTMLATALRGGQQSLFHVVGEGATSAVISLMEKLAPAENWRDRRVRIEHGSGITGAMVERARRLGIVIGQPRVEGGSPFRTWQRAGIPLAYGSDNSPNPFLDLMLVITSPTDPSEALSREEAVTMFTRGSAYAEFQEDQKGTLAPGRLADLAVLSQDIFSVRPDALPATTSVLTMVGGRVVYQAISSENGLARRVAVRRASALHSPGGAVAGQRVDHKNHRKEPHHESTGSAGQCAAGDECPAGLR
jgi:predicted amidohydrolase YtcJ